MKVKAIVRGCLFLLLVACMPLSYAGIQFVDCTFHDSTEGPYAEDTSTDAGGTLFITLYNNGGAAETVNNITINGTAVTGIANYKWHRVWPNPIQPGQTATVTVKATSAPLAEGQTISVGATCASGASATFNNWYCQTYKMRLGHMVLSQDMRYLYIYVRNTDSAATYTPNFVRVGIADKTANTTFINCTNIANNGVGIMRVDLGAAQANATPLFVMVKGAKSTGGDAWVGAPFRCFSYQPILGTWSSSMNVRGDGQRYFRRMRGDNTTGSGDEGNNYNMYWSYGVQAWPEIDFVADPAYVQRNVNNPVISFWHIDDEPDLNNKLETEELNRNQVCWNYDTSHPTYLNLCFSKKFNRYGHIADIASMDHYVAYAPNIIQGTGSTRIANFDEAYEYTDALKKNTEPRMMYNYCQMWRTGDGNQPSNWMINLQWHAHLMGGAKGFTWFKYGPDYETQYASLTQEGMKIGKMWGQYKWLAMYGDMNRQVTTQYSQIKARQIVGENQTMAVVCNYNYKIAGFPWAPSYSIGAKTGNVTVPVPAHIPIQTVKQIVSGGYPTTPGYTQSGQTLTIPVNFHKEMLVYVIGRTDSTGPNAPSVRLGGSAGGNWLVWNEPYDNWGVTYYNVFRSDGTYLATLNEPIYAAAPGQSYYVHAYDPSGNASAASNVVYVPGYMTAFSDTTNFEGWTMDSQIANAGVNGGVLYWDNTGGDPYMTSPGISVDAANKRVWISWYNGTASTSAQLYYATAAQNWFDETKSKTISVTAYYGNWYCFDFTGDANFTGTITRLRFDPGYSTGSCNLAEIKMQP